MRFLRLFVRVVCPVHPGPTGVQSCGRPALPLAAFSLVTLATPALLAAQHQGTITYTHVVKRDIQLPPALAEWARERPPRTGTVILHFNPASSLMTRAADRSRDRETAARFRGGDRATDATNARRARMAGRFGFGLRPGTTPDAASVLQAAYLDYGDGTMVEARRFLGRTFRVTRERPSLGWRIGVEQADHLGYTVMKATAEHDGTTVEAWFTPQIPVPGGPASYGGLPGMILVLSVNDGQTQYQATEVALREPEAGLIRPPEDGDEVSYEEFEQLVRERIEEMRRSRRPPGPAGGPEELER